jgi:hypothetical protein
MMDELELNTSELNTSEKVEELEQASKLSRIDEEEKQYCFPFVQDTPLGRVSEFLELEIEELEQELFTPMLEESLEDEEEEYLRGRYELALELKELITNLR